MQACGRTVPSKAPVWVFVWEISRKVYDIGMRYLCSTFDEAEGGVIVWLAGVVHTYVIVGDAYSEYQWK
jgi:hypothetical protein